MVFHIAWRLFGIIVRQCNTMIKPLNIKIIEITYHE